MIVMLSALGERPSWPGQRSPPALARNHFPAPGGIGAGGQVEPATPAGPGLIATFRLWTKIGRVWTIWLHQVFSSHTRWTALPLVTGLPRAYRSALSSVLSPARAQRRRRVCTSCPQTCAQRDWTPRRAPQKTVVTIR